MAGLREVFEARLAATRHDVAGLREVFEARLAATEAGVRTEMHQGFRRMTVWVVSLQVATLGAVAALTRLG